MMINFLRKLFHRQPLSQQVNEDTDLLQFYTNTVLALQVFEQLATATDLPKRLLVVHGIGGVGKSTLLKMYLLSCRNHHLPVALAASEETPSSMNVLADWATGLNHDGIAFPAFQKTLTHYRSIQAKVENEVEKRHQAKDQLVNTLTKTAIAMAASAIPVIGPMVSTVGSESAAAFMDWLRSFLPKPDIEFYLNPTKQLDKDFLSDLTSVVSRQRIVLMVDTYEQMTTLDDWMRELTRRLPRNVLVVIAGRTMPAWDRAWQGWMSRAEIVDLKEMTADDIRTLVHRYYAFIRGGDPDPKQVEAIVQFARGLPMVATTVVQLWVKYGLEDFQTVRPQVVADLVDRLLEGVPQEMQPAFEVAAVLRYFNVEALGALLNGGNAETLYAELRRWPFIRSRREGLAIHDTMREMINEALQVRTPERFRLLHERAAVFYERQEKATGDERESSLFERLYHRTVVDESIGMQLFRQQAEELTRYHMMDRLRALLNDVNTYPLKSKNYRLWREYYNARLTDLEGQMIRAEKVYQMIGEDERANPDLRAYSLCDWGMLIKLRRIGKGELIEKALWCHEKSLELAPLDSKLVANLLQLSRIYRDQAKWDRALEYLMKALEFYTTSSDSYGRALTYLSIHSYYAYLGDWTNMFLAYQKGLEVIPGKEASFLRAKFLESLAIAWIWTGRYSEVISNIQKSIDIQQKLGVDLPFLGNLRDLGLALAFAGKPDVATHYFNLDLEQSRRMSEYSPREEAVTLGFLGTAIIRQGVLERAQEVLTKSLDLKLSLQDTSYLLDTLIWLGTLSEMRNDPTKAESYFAQCLDYRWTGRHYFECGALTGLVRVKYTQKNYIAIPPLWTEAERLAQEYEYNDYFTSLYLTRGHITFEGLLSEWAGDFDSALHYYQLALVHALRFNRFLLDEVLTGREQGTPLLPVIPYCLEHGEEGQRMLVALRDWWQSGSNDTGTSRSYTISPIPEGIPLLEAERIAREREPGDDSPQTNVVEHINAALSAELRHQ